MNEVSELDYIPGLGLSDIAQKYIQSYFSEKILDTTRLIEASKNVAMGTMFKISNAVTNLMASHRGVDMNDPKAGAAKSPKNWQSKQFSMDNFMTIPMMKEENAAGKDVIGISAVGMKVFYNSSFYYNEELTKLEKGLTEGTLNEEQVEKEIERLASPKKFTFFNEKTKQTKTIITTFFANINFTKTPRVSALYDILIEKLVSDNPDAQVIDARTLSDKSLTMSAMVSAATDNAKELILAKINAGPELAGTYISMIMQGIDFLDIADFMVSPTIDAIVKKSKSNVFTGETSSIDKAIDYFENGVNPRSFLDSRVIQTLNVVMGSDYLNLIPENHREKLMKEGSVVPLGSKLGLYTKLLPAYQLEVFKNKLIKDTGGSNGIFGSDYQESNDYGDPMDMIYDVPEYTGNSRRSTMNISLQRYFKEVGKRNDMLVSLNSSADKYANMDDVAKKVLEFKQIYKDAQEFKVLGTRYGINGGMKTDHYGQYNFDRSLASHIWKLIVKNNNNIGISEAIKNYPNVSGSPMAKLVDLLDISKIHAPVDPNNKNEVRALEFRRKALIELYNDLKGKTNIIEAELNVPHMSAMHKVNITAQQLYKTSTKYDYTEKLMKELYRSHIPQFNGEFLHKFKEEQIKGIERFVFNEMVDKFFSATKFSLKIPDGINIYDNDFKVKESLNSTLDLATPHGKASFKTFVEEYMLSKLKNDNPANKFIQGLITDSTKDPLNNAQFLFIKTDIDLMSVEKNPNEKLRYSDYLIGLDQMQGVSLSSYGVDVTANGTRNVMSVADMFMLYNTLLNNNAFGKNTFTKMFEDTLDSERKGRGSVILNLMQYIGTLDGNKDERFGEKLNLEQLDLSKLAIMIAPIVKESDLYRNHGAFVKVYNTETGLFDIYSNVGDEDQVDYEPYSTGKIVNGVPSKFYYTSGITSNYQINSLSLANLIQQIKEKHDKGEITINIDC